MFEKYKDKGITGIENLGNTCFINTAIQCLSHTYEFNEYLNSEKYKTYMNKKIETILLKEYDDLRKLMWSENCKISPQKFVDIIRKIAKIKKKDLFTGWAQNDLPEFLYFIFECFHEGTSREVEMEIKGKIENKEDLLAKSCYEMIKKMYSKEYSDILKIFYGISVTNCKTVENGNIIENNNIAEPYLMIDLPIVKKENLNLYDCLDEYTNQEEIELNDEKKIIKKVLYWSFPEVMIISLKRFNDNLKKNNILVNYPLDNLDMSKYVCGYNKNSYKYELFGICNHEGNVNGGHYFAYIKNANNKWYIMNDLEVKEIKMDNIISNKGYCLFYRKKK